MKIIVKAKASAKEEKVERLTQPTLGFEIGKAEPVTYKVWFQEPAVDGKANVAVIKAMQKPLDLQQ